MTHQLGDAPIQADYAAQMQAAMAALDEMMNGESKGSDRAVGIVVLMFPFGATEGRCNFISNGADRRDLVTLFKEMAARFEGQPEMRGRA